MGKKRRILLGILLWGVLLVSTVLADGGNRMDVWITVNSDGSCQVEQQLELYLDPPIQELQLPLGGKAKDITVNGGEFRAKRGANGYFVQLQRESGYSGSQSFTIRYRLPNCLHTDTDWALTVPILPGGLSYPLQEFYFLVTMPGDLLEMPVFSSGYYGTDIDNYMTVQVEGNEVRGSMNADLRDRESLILEMPTVPEQFPRNNEAGRMAPAALWLAAFTAVAAVVYWAFKLRWKPVRLQYQAEPPVGFSLGELPCQLLGKSPDLALMILSWAQLGYLTIQLEEEQAVTLHKRISMGNERSEYENQLFSQLFGFECLAHSSGRKYQTLRAQVEASRPRVRGQFRKKGGNPFLLRLLGALVVGFVVFAMVDRMISPMKGRFFLVLLALPLGWVLGWLLQGPLACIFGGSKRPLWLFLVSAGVVLFLGLLSGSFLTAILAVLFCLIQNGVVLFGGQRSEAGRERVQSLLSFRQYLQTVEQRRLREILEQNPNYYYDLAPYALALGVDRSFADRLGTLRMPDCPWLVSADPQGNRAPEWYPALRQVTQILRGGKMKNTRFQRLRRFFRTGRNDG